MGLTDRETSNRQTVEWKFAEICGTLFAQIVITTALHNSEYRLRRVAPGPQRTLGPPMGELHRVLGLGMRRGGSDAVVEHHHDVAADRLLHLDAGFR